MKQTEMHHATKRRSLATASIPFAYETAAKSSMREPPPHAARRYFNAITIESGPSNGCTRVELKPASFIHAEQSAPV